MKKNLVMLYLILTFLCLLKEEIEWNEKNNKIKSFS